MAKIHGKMKIRSKREGFRRGGVAHSEAWTEYKEDVFTKAQYDQIMAENVLQVDVESGMTRGKVQKTDA
jgi:hypothetical protein